MAQQDTNVIYLPMYFMWSSGKLAEHNRLHLATKVLPHMSYVKQLERSMRYNIEKGLPDPITSYEVIRHNNKITMVADNTHYVTRTVCPQHRI